MGDGCGSPNSGHQSEASLGADIMGADKGDKIERLNVDVVEDEGKKLEKKKWEMLSDN